MRISDWSSDVCSSDLADKYGAANGNLIGSMAQRRADWMMQMLRRENRIVDIQIINSLKRNATFFASTSMLILAGLITLLGVTQQAIDLVRDLPIAHKTSRQLWEAKVLLLGMVFVYAFFKFGWAMRQLSYCSILVGATRPATEAGEDAVQVARDSARVPSLAAHHSNPGIRASYFGLGFGKAAG